MRCYRSFPPVGPTMCSGPHTAAPGLANHVDCEPTSRAHMRGREPTISAHEPRFMARSSQTATRTQIHGTQDRRDITVSVISHAMGVRSTRGMASSAVAFKRYRKTTFPRVCDFANRVNFGAVCHEARRGDGVG